jgi:hypothetical protein
MFTSATKMAQVLISMEECKAAKKYLDIARFHSSKRRFDYDSASSSDSDCDSDSDSDSESGSESSCSSSSSDESSVFSDDNIPLF